MLQYYAGIITCLIICIWIGSTINNLLLFYITGNNFLNNLFDYFLYNEYINVLFYWNVTVNILLLTPGFRYKGRAMSVISYVRDSLSHDKQS